MLPYCETRPSVIDPTCNNRSIGYAVGYLARGERDEDNISTRVRIYCCTRHWTRYESLGEILNIATCTNFVLGQLSFKEDGLTSNDYSRWLDKRYKTYARDRHELGFTVYNGPPEYYYPSLDDFNSVTAEWKRRLNDRS